MKNRDLVQDYFTRSQARIKALHTLMDEKSYADVARESQEIVELCAKGILRHFGIEPARVHDVSEQLKEIAISLKEKKLIDINIVISASRALRRDRELAFYGGEDLTPGKFYQQEDAVISMGYAKECVRIFGGFLI